MENKCGYPLFEKLVQETHNKTILEHLGSCLSCQEKLFMWEMVLPLLNLQNELSLSDLSIEETEELFSFAQDYQKKKAKVFQEKSELWKKILNNEKLLLLFQKILRAYTLISMPTKAKLPEAVKNYLEGWMKGQIESSKKLFIIMGESLKLLGGFWENARLVPLFSVPVRHNLPQSINPNQILKFSLPYAESLDEAQGEILYQVMKDGEQNLLLTVGIGNCHPKPRVVSLKREGRLLHSYPIRDDFLYFPQLTVGSYEMEFKDSEGQVKRKVEFTLFIPEN